MADFRLPFPGRELADDELARDPCCARIPQEDRACIVEAAWAKGCAAAREVYNRTGGETDFFTICRSGGLELVEKDVDYVAGSQRYFSDYISGQKVINLYLRSIDLWAGENGMDRPTAENLILSHEYYHFLEVTRLGLTSRDYQVPVLQIGPFKIGKTGVRALSEIGAHAFARTYYELAQAKEGEHGTET